MRVLITGDRGFIGRHLLAECVRRGYLADRLDTTVTPSQDCRLYFRSSKTRFDLVFHCAATVGGRATIDGDPLAVATNLSLDAEMFNWALRTRPGRVVYFSSSAAYPVGLQQATMLVGRKVRRTDGSTCTHFDDVPNTRRLSESDIRLDDIGRPDQTYGWAKLTGEMLAEHVNDAGIPVHVFRPFSGYGSDQSPDYPFPAFIDRALRRADPFEIWGDGRQTRDFIHVDDIVAAVFTAVEQDVRGPVNLCTGRATTFDDLAYLVTGAAGYRPEFKYLPAAPTGVQHRVGDPTLMSSFYTPTVPLEEAIAPALEDRA